MLAAAGPRPRTLVFCNKIDGCRDVENHLMRRDPDQERYRVFPFHEAIRDELRNTALAAFLAPLPVKASGSGHGLGANRARRESGRGWGPADSDDEDGPTEQSRVAEPRDLSALPVILVATDRTSRGGLMGAG